MGWGLLFMTGVVLPFKKKVCVRVQIDTHTHKQKTPYCFGGWWLLPTAQLCHVCIQAIEYLVFGLDMAGRQALCIVIGPGPFP